MVYRQDPSDDHDGHVGHSNDSLLASADEMAGNYSPHTPHTPNNAFMPIHLNSSREMSAALDNALAPGSTEEGEKPMEDYPMPEEPEIWQQAVHPDSFQKLLNEESEATLETFTGAAKILSHVNPDYFLMPLKSRIVCMKLDRLFDMKYAINNGYVTNLPVCNERLSAIWKSRAGERVFMMFSISGSKEFCAMAEMTGDVQSGELPGWTKPGCSGVIPITFIFIKDVPFKLINHIKHKTNGQPVANMWNSMLYHDNTGYHVARIYARHPVLSSLLATSLIHLQIPYKAQLRIPGSDKSNYSASSYNSHNDKLYDPRAATQVSIRRSDKHGQWSGTDRRAIQNQSWRRNNAPQADSGPSPRLEMNDGNLSPTPAQKRSQGLSAPTLSSFNAPPPIKPLNNNYSAHSDTPRPSGSFITADERMLANFPGFQGARKPNGDRSTRKYNRAVGHPTAHSPTVGVGVGHAAARDGYDVRAGLPKAPLQITTDIRQTNDKAPGARQSSAFGVQWQADGRGAKVPIFIDTQLSGLGLSFNSSPSNSDRSDHGPAAGQMAGEPIHYPSPATPLGELNHGSRFQTTALTRPHGQGFSTPSPLTYHHKGFHQHQSGGPGPQSSQSANFSGFSKGSRERQKHRTRRGSPIKQSQSMPLMIPSKPTYSSSPALRIQTSGITPSPARSSISSSSGIGGWVAPTPTHPSFAPDPASEHISLSPILDNPYSPDKITRFLDLEEQYAYHQSNMYVLDHRLYFQEVARGIGRDEKYESRLLKKYHCSKSCLIKLQMKLSEKEHDEIRRELAEKAFNHSSSSSSRARSVSSDDSSAWPGQVSGSAFEKTIAPPKYDEHGEISRSASMHHAGKPNNTTQVLRHRRGGVYDPNKSSFSGSFDARVTASVDKLLESPTREDKQPSDLLLRRWSRPTQRSSNNFTDSVPTAPPAYNGSSTVQGSDSDAISFKHASPASVTEEEDDDVFAPRGRSYWNANPIRGASQASFHGGIGLKNEYWEYK